MKRFLIILCAMALVFGWTTSGVAVLYDYNQPPIADAMVDSFDTSVNYGSENTLWIQGTKVGLGMRGSERISYLKFDLSSIPDSMTFISAELGIYFYERYEGFNMAVPEVLVHRVSDDTWTESGITYDNKPPPPGFVSAHFVDTVQLLTSDPGYVTWDLLIPTSPPLYSWESDYPSDLVDNYVSFLIQPKEFDKNNYAKFYSREGTTPPYLKIEYIPEPATIALLGLGALSLLRRKRRAKFVPKE